LEFFGGVPDKILIDNPKTAVLKHPAGESPLFHPPQASHRGCSMPRKAKGQSIRPFLKARNYRGDALRVSYQATD
jgi:transposase